MDKKKKQIGRPGGVKTIDGNKKDIRRFLAGDCANFETYYNKMTNYEKGRCIMEYLKGEI